jgi:hypothetical protein
MRCPKCGHEFPSPVAQAGGRAGGAAKVAKGFAVAGQPSVEARKRGWAKRKARAKRSPNAQGEHSPGATTEGDMIDPVVVPETAPEKKLKKVVQRG